MSKSRQLHRKIIIWKHFCATEHCKQSYSELNSPFLVCHRGTCLRGNWVFPDISWNPEFIVRACSYYLVCSHQLQLESFPGENLFFCGLCPNMSMAFGKRGNFLLLIILIGLPQKPDFAEHLSSEFRLGSCKLNYPIVISIFYYYYYCF